LFVLNYKKKLKISKIKYSLPTWLKKITICGKIGNVNGAIVLANFDK
jgi:hypothetical protein